MSRINTEHIHLALGRYETLLKVRERLLQFLANEIRADGVVSP